MLDFLYAIFIAPLEWGMRFVLEHAYTWTDSYGAAIIILSLVVNTVLLPLYNKADAWQQEDRAKQAKMTDKIAEIKLAFKGQERFMMLKTLYRQHHYHPIMAARNSVGFLIQVPFFFAAYQLLSHYDALNGQAFGPFADLGVADALVNIGAYQINLMPFVMTAINLLSAFIYTKGLTSKDKIQLYVFAGIFLVLLYTSPAGLVLYWTLNNFYSLLKNILYSILKGVRIEKRYSLLYFFKSALFKITQRVVFFKPVSSIYTYYLSIIVFIYLSVIYAPLNLYISDASFFKVTLADVFINQLTLFTSILILFTVIYVVTSESLRNKLGFIALFLSIYSVVYVLLPIRNYGSIDGYFLTNEAPLSRHSTPALYDFIIVILIYFLTRYLVRKKLLSIYNNILVITLIVTCCFLLYKIEFLNRLPIKDTPSTLLIPTYNDTLNSYSKNDKNIVIFMLDMFTGDHVAKILSDYGKLKDELTGFIWYPDTLTVGNATFLGEPAIHGGFQYTPGSMNKRSHEIDSLQEEIAKGYRLFVNGFSNKGFDVSLFGTQFATCVTIDKYIEKDNLKVCTELSAEQDYSQLLAQKDNLEIDTSDVNDLDFLSVYGLFTVTPYSRKKKIYDSGTWLDVVHRDFRKSTLAPYALIDLLPQVSNINSTNATFKYIQVSAPHLPWYITKDLKITNVDPYPATKGQLVKVDGIIPEHLYAEAFTLQAIANYVTWLKLNGIFDNTMIVLVSDHGEGDSLSLSKTFGINVKGNHAFGTNQGYDGRPHGLLMVKDFGAKSKFKESSEFMSTADVPSLVCTAVGGCEGIAKDPRKISNNRQLPYFIGNWDPKEQGTNEYKIDKEYQVTGSMFNKENWKQIK